MRLRLLPFLGLAAIPLAIASACTNDFDVFEGTSAEGGASSSSGGSSSSSSSSGSSSSSSSGSPGDAATVDAPDCKTTSGSCYTQEQTCNAKCSSDHATCTGNCSPGNQGRTCRKACDDAQTTCTNNCKTTCEQCAGPPCRAGCP